MTAQIIYVGAKKKNKLTEYIYSRLVGRERGPHTGGTQLGNAAYEQCRGTDSQMAGKNSTTTANEATKFSSSSRRLRTF